MSGSIVPNALRVGVAAMMIATAVPASAGSFPVGALSTPTGQAAVHPAIAAPGEAQLVEVKAKKKRRSGNNAAAAAIIGGIAALGVGAAIASRNRGRYYDDGYYYGNGYGYGSGYGNGYYGSRYYGNRAYGNRYYGNGYAANPRYGYRRGYTPDYAPQRQQPGNGGGTLPRGTCYLPPGQGGPSYYGC